MKTAKCPECKKEMVYNNHYHCYKCQCGETYNAFLQKLRPVEDWAREYDEEDY